MTRRQVVFVKKKKLLPGLEHGQKRSSSDDIYDRAYGSSRREAGQRSPTVTAAPPKTGMAFAAGLVALLTFMGVTWLNWEEVKEPPRPVSTYRQDIENSLLWRGQRATGSDAPGANAYPGGGGRGRATEESFIATYPKSGYAGNEPPTADLNAAARPAPTPKQNDPHGRSKSVDCGVSMNSSEISATQINGCLEHFDGR